MRGTRAEKTKEEGVALDRLEEHEEDPFAEPPCPALGVELMPYLSQASTPEGHRSVSGVPRDLDHEMLSGGLSSRKLLRSPTPEGAMVMYARHDVIIWKPIFALGSMAERRPLIERFMPSGGALHRGGGL